MHNVPTCLRSRFCVQWSLLTVLRCGVDSCVRTLDTSCWWSRRTTRRCQTSSLCSCPCRTRSTVCVTLSGVNSPPTSSSNPRRRRPRPPSPPLPLGLPPPPPPRRAPVPSWRRWRGRNLTTYTCVLTPRRLVRRRCHGRAVKPRSDLLISTVTSTAELTFVGRGQVVKRGRQNTSTSWWSIRRRTWWWNHCKAPRVAGASITQRPIHFQRINLITYLDFVIVTETETSSFSSYWLLCATGLLILLYIPGSKNLLSWTWVVSRTNGTVSSED